MAEIRLATVLFELMKKDPERLFSINDLMEIYKNHHQLKTKEGRLEKYRAIEGVMRNLRVANKIFRHTDKDVNGDLQYAVSIPKNKIEVWILQTRENQAGIPKNATQKRRKDKLLSSKEIRSMFAAHYNNMAKLEDACMAIIEQSESTEHEMEKIRKFLK